MPAAWIRLRTLIRQFSASLLLLLLPFFFFFFWFWEDVLSQACSGRGLLGQMSSKNRVSDSQAASLAAPFGVPRRKEIVSEGGPEGRGRLGRRRSGRETSWLHTGSVDVHLHD